tara:strand:+ start:28 stop:435 length:408 start_codon:yes stop_codon:yes gene_type:complete
MESEKLIIMQEFRNQLVIFLDEIIDLFPLEGDFVLIRMFIKDQVPIYDVLGRFIRDILPLKEFVDNRDESFFLNNTILYTGGNLNDDKIDHFKKIWSSNMLDEENKEIIWQWMNCLFTIAEKYYKRYGFVKGWSS